jgi:hypothetical protein
VDAALPDVAVPGAVVAVAVPQPADVAQVVADAGGVDGGVLPALPVRQLARRQGGRAQAGLADLPDRLLLPRVVVGAHGRPHRRPRDAGPERVDLGVEIVGVVRAELDQQPAAAVGQQVQAAGVQPDPAHVADEGVVEALQADRPVAQQLGDVVGGDEEIGVAEHDQAPVGGAGHQPDGRLKRQRAGRLGADQRAGDLEAPLGEQLVEVVAGHAPRDPGEAGADQVGVAVARARMPAYSSPRRPPARMIAASCSSSVGPTVSRRPS